MTITVRDEKRLLTADEFAAVEQTHYPNICDLGQKDLTETARRLRDMRAKARDTARQQRREMRGKAAPRGTKAAADNTGTTRKEQVFAGALKRVNREISRYRRMKGDEDQQAIMERALDQKRAARKPHHPSAGRTANHGMSATPDDGTQPKVSPSPPGG
ncbi:hypothetical protein [Caenispirillum bisanense]|uniref:hypothetical protein n=1 Tax=Caenispirillum bisanense TaxID=414052 RepID=UPI0031DD45CA